LPHPPTASKADAPRRRTVPPVFPDGAEPADRIAPAAAAGPASARPGTATAEPGFRAGGSVAAAPGAERPETESPGDPSTPDAKTPGEAEPGSDHTPPVLQLLRFDPPVVEGGGVTTLTIQASDTLSGMKSIRGEIRSPNKTALLPFGSGDVGGADVSAFPITIPQQAESGVWYVSWISLSDRAANTSLVQAPSAAAAPPGGTVTVSSSESDSTPPEVLQVWFDKSTVDGGDKNVIRVEARDDSSGVVSVVGASQSPSKAALLWFTGTPNADSGVWEGDLPIPKDADCGEWRVQQLAVKDKAGNTTLLMGDSPLLARAGFQVAFRADCDSTPPTLDAFDLSPTIVPGGAAAEIVVTATVSDEGSGVVAMTGWFDGPVSTGGQVPKNYFRCAPNPGDPTAPWTGKVVVPQLAAKGTWKVGVIRLEDKARNSREYTAVEPVVSGRVFEVQ